MADYILTPGQCAKADLYKTLKNAMIAAGWTNISSLFSTDFDVMKSPGNDGTKNLLLQMRPTNTGNANSTETTDYSCWSCRLLDSYAPGATNQAGTIARAATSWYNMDWLSENYSQYQVSAGTILNYRLLVDKNKIIMVVYPPASLTGLNPVVFFIGLPDSAYCDEPDSRGFIIAKNWGNGSATNVLVSNTPGGMSTVTAPYWLPSMSQLSPKNPNAAGVYCISEIFYGNTSEGPRGKIDGIFALPNTNILNGDILKIGDKQYQVLLNTVSGVVTSFPTTAIAIQIA